MIFKLVTITYLYPEYLDSIYNNNASLHDKPYSEQYNFIINDTTEPVGIYTQNFLNTGIDASCIITNAKMLQKRWCVENNKPAHNEKSIVIEQLKKANPDIIWIDNVSYLSSDWINTIKKQVPSIKLIFGSHCAPYYERNLKDFNNLDFIITCTPGINNSFKQAGLNSYLVYHAFDKNTLTPFKNVYKEYKHDFVFTGSLFQGGGFHSKRTEFIETILEEDIPLEIFGTLDSRVKLLTKKNIYYLNKALKYKPFTKLYNNLPDKFRKFGEYPIKNYSKKLLMATKLPVYGMNMFELIYNSKIVLNIHGEVAGNFAGNVRLFETTGMGTCLLTDNKKNLNELFKVNEEVITYSSVDDCIDKVKWLLSNDDERKKIAFAGQERTLKEHTIQNRCLLIKDIINRELKTKLKRSI